MGIADRRIQYETAGLDVEDLLSDPLEMLLQWYHQAEESGAAEPNAMVVSTIDADGAPDARTVLARAISQEGITFFTNYESAKGKQISEGSPVAATFTWLQLHRQVRVRGKVQQASSQVSDEYFASRPRASQIGAWASPQSQRIENRQVLEDLVLQAEAQFPGEVHRPPHWGGYLILVQSIEFWQGRPSRLHDRFLFERDGDGWTVHRLAP